MSREWKKAALEMGLGPRADWPEVQAAYRRLVLQLHPDVSSSPESAVRFRAISEAYRRLEELRREEEALARLLQDDTTRRLPVGELAMRLRYSASPALRRAAAFLLGRVEGDSVGILHQVRAALSAALDDRERSVRAAAAEALARTGGLAELPRAALRALERPASASAWLRAVAGRSGRAATAAWQRGCAALTRPAPRGRT